MHDFENEPKVQEWKSEIIRNGCHLKGLSPLSLHYKPSGELLFAFLDADVTTPDNHTIPSLIFLRGHAVLVVSIVQNRTTGEERYLMVEQRRIATGGVNLEFPAGMLDRDVKTPGYVALKELAEETGLSIEEKDLFPLSDRLLLSSPGACDEGIFYFGTIIALSQEKYDALHGTLRIHEDENERIRVVLKTEEEFLRENRSIQALAGYYLMKEKRSTL